MPSLPWTQSVAAGAVFRPLDGWQYERIPAGGQITILHDATAVGMVATITSGSDTLQERGPVSANGVTGVLPTMFTVPSIADLVSPGDLIKIQYENTTVGAIIVNGQVDYTPA